MRTVQASTAALAPVVVEQMHTDVSGPAVAAIGCSTGIGGAAATPAAAVTAALVVAWYQAPKCLHCRTGSTEWNAVEASSMAAARIAVSFI